jgi:hypothetical protein
MGDVIKRIVGIVVLSIACFTPVSYAAPQLISDMGVSNWVPAPEVRAVSATCRRYMLIVATCSIDIVDTADRGRIQQSLRYLLVTSWSGQTPSFVRSATNRQDVTAKLGVNSLTEREIVSLVFFIAAIGIVGMMIYLAMRKPLPPSPRPPISPSQRVEPRF